MKYLFPQILHIDEVLEALQGRIAPDGEFLVAKREGYTVIDYAICIPGPDGTFPDPMVAPDPKTARDWAIRRECRGLIFDQSGNLVSRGLHKFFNVNEKDETQAHLMPWPPAYITVKEDGSMVRAFRLPGEDTIRWATRMGETDIAADAGNYARLARFKGMDYEGLARFCLDKGYTPTFEWCSRSNQVVIDHPEDRMILISVRDNVSGDYMSRKGMEVGAAIHNVPLVEMRPYKGDLNSMIDHVRCLIGAEGVVPVYASGHRFKAKGDWYVQIHRAVDGLRQEKDVIAMILDGKLDDVLPMLPADVRARVTEYIAEFEGGLIKTGHKLDALAKAAWQGKDMVPANRGDAFRWLDSQGLDEYSLGIASRSLDGQPSIERLRRMLPRYLGSRNRVELVRHLWGGFRWNSRSILPEGD